MRRDEDVRRKGDERAEGDTARDERREGWEARRGNRRKKKPSCRACFHRGRTYVRIILVIHVIRIIPVIPV